MFGWFQVIKKDPYFWKERTYGVPERIGRKDLWDLTAENLKNNNIKVNFFGFLASFQENVSNYNNEKHEEKRKEMLGNKNKFKKCILRDFRKQFYDSYVNERNRQNNLDNKASKIIGQSSVLTAIIGIVVTYLAKFGMNFYSFLFTIIALLGIAFFVRSIILSIDVITTKPYSRPEPGLFEESLEETNLKRAIINQVCAFQKSFDINKETNSIKSVLIDNSYLNFKRGIIISIIIPLIVLILFWPIKMIFNLFSYEYVCEIYNLFSKMCVN